MGRRTVETTYRQDLASYGLPSLTVFKDGAGVERRRIAQTYSVNTTSRPYWVQNTRTDTTHTENYALSTRVQRYFDAYNNITLFREEGRTDRTGDERRTYFGFVPNTTDYIVSLPRYKTIFDASTAPHTRKTLEYYYYDGQTNAVAPLKGDMTNRFTYKVHPSIDSNSWAYEYYTYDSYGNRISARDGLGNRTEWDYDTTFNLLPTTTRLPRYFANGGYPADTRFVDTTAYNNTCQLPSTHTQVNGKISTYTYDAFCRQYNMYSPTDNSQTLIRYYYEGQPSSQRIYRYDRLPSGSASNWNITRTYYNGLGQIWASQSYGDSTTNPLRDVRTVYDKRGNVSSISQPRFVGETPLYTQTEYDWADRPKKITNPDGTTKLFYYYLQSILGGTSNVSLWATRLTDELGRLTYSYTSTFGQSIRVMRYGSDGNNNGGANYYNVNYFASYDVLDRLIQVRDAQYATWSYAYDYVGNRTSVVDPDLGSWSYKYDKADRLIEQTDARGTVTTMNYDQMGRPISRIVPATGC